LFPCLFFLGCFASALDHDHQRNDLQVNEFWRGINTATISLAAWDGGSWLFRTIHNLRGVNSGFDPLHIITFQVGLSPSVTNTPLRERIAYQQLVARIRQI